MNNDKRMTFGQHLEELRRRMLVALGSVVAFTLAAYAIFSLQLLWLLRAPFDAAPGAAQLATLSPIEMILVRIKLSMVAGIVAASPVIIYHSLAFIMPGLRPEERRSLRPALAAGLLLFVVGVLLCYLIVLPIFYSFMISMNNDAGVTAMWSVRSVVHSALMLLLSFGIGFELPIVIVFLTQIGIVTPSVLAAKRKYALLVILIVSAIITPPDVVTMLVLGGPLYILYELSVVLASIFHARRLRRISG